MNMRNSEGGVESVNDQKKNKSISLPTFLSAFTRDYVDNRPSNIKNQLIEEVMTQDTLSGTLAATGLAEFRATEEKYSDVELDKIDVYTLRKYLAKGYASLEGAKRNFESFILSEYDISAEVYEKKIQASIAKKGEKEINRLISNESERVKFLQNLIGNTQLSTRVNFDIFDGLSESQIQSRISSLPGPQKSEITGVLMKIQNGKVPRDDEVRAIVESPIFDSTQKVLFVHTFLPYITLESANELGIISDVQAQKIKDTFIKQIIDGKSLSADNVDSIAEQLSFSDIQVRTKDIVTSGEDAIKVSEGIGFEDFVQSYVSKQQQIVESIKAQGPETFQGLVIMLGELDTQNKYRNIAQLAPEKIIEFKKLNREGEQETSYVEIIDFDDKKQSFRFKTLGNDRINLESPSELQSISYADFISNLQKSSSTELEIHSKQFIQEQISSGLIKTTNFKTLGEENFEGSENIGKRSEIKQEEIERLESELAEKRSSLVNTDDEALKKKITGDISQLEKRISYIRNIPDISANQAKEWYNKKEFLRKLDELDSEGKEFGFGTHTAFYFGGKIGEKGSKFGTYSIQKIDYESWTVSFIGESGLESDINLDDFIATFEEKKAKRMKSFQSIEELMAEDEAFSGHKFESGKIVAKNAEGGDGKNTDREVEFLGSSENDTILKIISVSGNLVDVQIGERSDDKLSDAEKKKFKKKQTLKIKGAKISTWTLDELARFIEQEKLKPDWKIGQNYTEVPQDQQNPIKGSLISRVMSNFSIHDIIHGGKTVIEGITESLNQGAHVKSAHAALMMGKFLPEELKQDLKSKVEAAEAEEMDKALKQLGAVDSWIAVERIEKWLLNKNTPEAKKEAGLLFMLEKYGHLTSKKALYKYRGKFLWYEAFGGRKGDALYNDIKAEVEADGQVFSEEKLMHMLLKKQCSGHGFNGIHRRSRLHKEYENKWKSGVTAEFEKGEKDASNFRNPKTMVREGMGEAIGGTTSNAFGWAKKAVDRGGAQEDMMHIPSAILLSGACYDLDQVTYNKVKALWDAEGQPVIAFRMFAKQSLMDLYNNTVFHLSQEIGDAYPSMYPDIKSDAKKLKEMSQNRDKPEKERLEAADTFWKKYGEPLSRALNMSLEGDTKFGKTDNIIRRKKDDPRFAAYYKTVRNAVGEGDNFKSGYVDDWVGESGIFGLNPYTISLKYLFMDQGGGFREKSIAPKIWGKYTADIDATRNKLFVGNDINSPENRTAQEEYIADLLQDIVGAFYEMSGLRPDYIFGLNKSTSPVGYNFNKWGLNLERDIGLVSSTDIMNGDLKDNFRKAARKIISGQGGDDATTPDVLRQQVQSQTAANLSRGSAQRDD